MDKDEPNVGNLSAIRAVEVLLTVILRCYEEEEKILLKVWKRKSSF